MKGSMFVSHDTVERLLRGCHDGFALDKLRFDLLHQTIDLMLPPLTLYKITLIPTKVFYLQT
jgi:hypothetical protein